MKYILLMYASENVAPKFSPEETKAVQQKWFDYMKDAAAAGVLVSNNGLAPVTNATTLRLRNGKRLVTDGPFAETHEQLAGFSMLECKDLDEALEWAARVPMAEYGSVEIRPTWDSA